MGVMERMSIGIVEVTTRLIPKKRTDPCFSDAISACSVFFYGFRNGIRNEFYLYEKWS